MAWSIWCVYLKYENPIRENMNKIQRNPSIASNCNHMNHWTIPKYDEITKWVVPFPPRPSTSPYDEQRTKTSHKRSISPSITIPKNDQRPVTRLNTNLYPYERLSRHTVTDPIIQDTSQIIRCPVMSIWTRSVVDLYLPMENYKCVNIILVQCPSQCPSYSILCQFRWKTSQGPKT